MSLRNPRLWIALLSAIAVVYVAVRDVTRTAPGPLAAVHHREASLLGFNSCAQCHGGWFGNMTESCLECHDAIAGQIEERAGLHGALGKDKAAQCALCHSEHHGEDFAMVNERSFALAGVEDPQAFDHTLVGFVMDGRHTEIGCTDCHEHAEAPVLPKGALRFGGLAQDCATCHEDPHEGRMGALACAQCHGQTSFDTLHSLGHETHLPLVGGHGEVACRTCHAESEAHSLEALGAGRTPRPRACADCHASPHRPAFVSGTDCAVCHVAEHTSFRDERLALTPAQHAPSGFLLEAPHDAVTCGKCHDGRNFTARYPGRAADDCAACHTDPHGGQFGPQICLDCHERHRFEPHTFTVARHAKTSFALTGRHEETDCGLCHRQRVGAPRAFSGTTSRCATCHDDAHDGAFRDAACSTCHDTASFASVEAFDHRRWTGFGLFGAHAQARCESCHRHSEEPDSFGRRFGRVAERFGEYESCATCHEDPHEGRFDRKGLPRTVKGKTTCARCHSEVSFRALPRPFDHGKWTGFLLVGAHAKLDCSDCHRPLRRPDEVGRTWAHASGETCQDCHDDPHAGQFKRNGVTDCQRCHRSATSFGDITFRHDLDARFRLGSAHAKVACATCHKRVTVGKETFVRYRPLGRRCSDCHEGLRDPLRRRGR